MKINFVLPFYSEHPGGGIKMMLEYSDRLSMLGHDVMVYTCIDTPYLDYHPLNFKWLRIIQRYLRYYNNPKPRWFRFQSNNVKHQFITRLENKYIRNADSTIITWWSLVELLAHLDERKGKKINLIQDYEIWTGHEDKVKATYQYNEIKNVVISPYLYDIVYQYDQNVELIPNAIDTKRFRPLKSVEERIPYSFIMLYSREERKASAVGIRAFIHLKKEYPELRLTLFGVHQRPEDLPDWIIYEYKPEYLEHLYNENRFFVTNSITEGWGLPLHEAMACGCLCICTDIEGHRQFIENNPGMITYKANSEEDLVQKLTSVLAFSDEKIRQCVSENHKIIRYFTWEESIKKLLNLIKHT